VTGVEDRQSPANPIVDTAFYCCGVRMLDAQHAHPVCNDQLAQRFMDERGLRIFAPFRSETMPNIGNITRRRIIDGLVRDQIARNANVNVLVIGAGFDTRAYRISGGNWIEIDEPQLISFKNEKLPLDECPNPLRRIAIDFSKESLAARLSDVASPIMVIIEGVFMYLDEGQITSTLRQIQHWFPEHELICDLMNRAFFRKFAWRVHAKFAPMGARFTDRPEKPEILIEDLGYSEAERISIMRTAHTLGVFKKWAGIPRLVSRLLLDLLLKDLNDYSIHRFLYAKR
jgi:methyltransferase (TIGR00027 family)